MRIGIGVAPGLLVLLFGEKMGILDQLDAAEKYFKLWPWLYIPAGNQDGLIILPREHLRSLIDCAVALRSYASSEPHGMCCCDRGEAARAALEKLGE